jgi:hypothetical protein
VLPEFAIKKKAMGPRPVWVIENAGLPVFVVI